MPIARRDAVLGLIAVAASASGCGHSARARPQSPRWQSDPFALGVASGDPAPDGFVLWTRIISVEPLHAPVIVEWVIAEDEQLSRVVRSGRASATPERAHCVHVEARGLRPGRDYWYRFRSGNAASRVGRTRTSPDKAPRLRVALASCQHWEHGYFTAYGDMLARQTDLIVHVGDYIYEKTWGAQPFARSHGEPESLDLDGYRRRHALYKTDEHLQAAHAQIPFVCTWDDHEVSNDYAGLAGDRRNAAEQFAQRRAAAYQAYLEHMPVRPSLWADLRAPRMFRRIAWGDLACFHVLDTRQYRDRQPCGSDAFAAGRAIDACSAAADRNRSILGASQERWLTQGLNNERAAWSLITQQVLFSRMALDDGKVWSDFWDGYAPNRERVVDALQSPSVRNAVMLGGDIHSLWAADIKTDYRDLGSRTIGAELVTTCLASRNPAKERFGDVLTANPHIKAMDPSCSGYVLMDIEHERLTGRLMAVDDLMDPRSACRPRLRLECHAGVPGWSSVERESK